MESLDEQSEADYLEAQLLTDPVENADSEKILHTATFSDFEERFLNYETLQWIVISLLLILAWGVGVILLLYTPVRRYIMKRDFRSRKLYVTSDAIVYKVTRPAFLPWLGVSKTEKCILLPLITDIVLEQGCLQSLFGLHSIRIETLGQGPLDSYSVSVCGMTNPRQFRKVVLMAATIIRKDGSLPENSPIRESNVILGLSKPHFQSGSQSQTVSSPQGTMGTPRQASSKSSFVIQLVSLTSLSPLIMEHYQKTNRKLVMLKLFLVLFLISPLLLKCRATSMHRYLLAVTR